MYSWGWEVMELFSNLDASHLFGVGIGAFIIIGIDAIFDRRAWLAAWCSASSVAYLFAMALHAGGAQ